MHLTIKKSIVKHFANLLNPLGQLYVDGYSEYSKPVYPRCELRIDGPDHRDITRNLTQYLFSVTILVQSTLTDNIYFHDQLVEKVVNIMKEGILIENSGCANLDDDITVVDFGKTDNDLPIIQTSVSTDYIFTP